MPDPLIQTYVDRAIAQLRRLDRMRVPARLPEAMRDESIPPSNDWIGWKPVPSTVSDVDLDALEHETRRKFPPLYRDFLKYLHFVELDSFGFTFEPHMSHNWKEVLRESYFRGWPRERILDVGLIPFGEEAQMDAGPTCFDTRRRLANGDCPVVFWDHEWVSSDQEIKPLFSSSAKMFECLAFAAATDLYFIATLEGDDDVILERKSELLSQFLAIDPDGAGGPALDYWTCGGISPKP